MFSLKLKVMVATVIAAALPVGGYFVAEYQGTAQRVDAAAKALLSDSSERSQQKVESWMDSNRGGLETMAMTPDFMERAKSEKEEDKAFVKARMILGIDQLPWVRASFLADESGQQLVRSNDDRLIKIGDREYFKQARFGILGAQLVISRTNFVPVLNLSKAMNDKDGKFNGAIHYTINVDAITDQIVKEKVGKTGFKFMLDADGGLLAHADKKQAELKNDALPVYVNHPLWRLRPQGDKVETASFEFEGKKFMGGIAKAGNFYVAAVLPQEEINEPLVKQRNDAFIGLGAALVLSLLMAYLVGAVLSRPLRTLAQAAEAISMAKFEDEKLDAIKSNDEIGALARSVKKLSNSVRIAMVSMKAAEARRAK